MSIERAGGARPADQADAAKRAAADQPKTKRFGETLKKERSKETDKADEKGKADKKKESGKAEKKDVFDELMGRDVSGRERIEGRGEGEGGGRGEGGRGGEGGEGSQEMADLEGRAKEMVSGEGKTEAAGKGAKGEGSGKADAFEKIVNKGRDQENVQKSDTARDAEVARRLDKPGAADTAKISEKDDTKSLQEQLKQDMFGGAITHPFLLQQQQVAEVQATAPAQPVIPPEIVDKIVQNARFGMNAEGAHEFQIDLKDSVYSGLKMKISTKDGKVSVNFIAENPEVQAQFEAKAEQVAKQLADRGLNVTSVSVQLGESRQDASQGESRGKNMAAGGVGGAKRTKSGGFGTQVDTERRSGKDYTA